MTKQHINTWVLILTFFSLGIPLWSVIGIGDSDPFTIDRRVKPVISNSEPAFGPLRGGTTLTVKGDKFYNGLTTVKLGGIDISSITIKSVTELSFKTPKGDIGLADLEISNPKGISTKLSQAFRYQAPLAQMVEVKAAEDVLVANGVSTTQITVRLQDQYGQLVTSETVNLSADRGTIPAQAINNKDGTYTATYTSDHTTGKATITAVTATNGKLGKMALTLTPASVVKMVEVKAAEDVLVANGVSTTQITVRLQDQYGQLAPNETVKLSADRGTIPAQATNNKDGTYTATYTSGHTTGKVIITAVTATNGKSGKIVITLTQRRVSAERSTISLDRNLAMIGQKGATLTVKLVDEQGLAMKGRVVGAKVEPVSDVTVGTAQPTDQKGLTQLKIQSKTIGQRIVTLSAEGITLASKAKIEFVSNQVTNVSIDVDKVQNVGQLVTIIMTLQNSDQLPVSGQLVEVLIEPSAGVTVTQPSQVSDAQGKLEAQLFSQTAGLKMLKVKSSDSLLENGTAITFQTGSVDKIEIKSEKILLRPEITTILKVSVTDQYNNPLKNLGVKLEATLGKIGLITDNGDGTYSAIFTTPSQLGKVVITATVAGKSGNLRVLFQLW